MSFRNAVPLPRSRPISRRSGRYVYIVVSPQTSGPVPAVPVSRRPRQQTMVGEKYEAAQKRKEQDRKDIAFQNFKTTVIVSGFVVAVAGALFAITKKLREK